MQAELVDLTHGHYELRCPQCQGLVMRVKTDHAEGLEMARALSVEDYGHRCGNKATGPIVGRKRSPEPDVGQWQGLRRVERPLEPVPVAAEPSRLVPGPTIRVATPFFAPGAMEEAKTSGPSEGILWYSETQKAEWQAQGRAPAYGQLQTGEIVEYTQLFSDRFLEEKSSYPDAICLGPGRFDHVG